MADPGHPTLRDVALWAGVHVVADRSNPFIVSPLRSGQSAHFFVHGVAATGTGLRSLRPPEVQDVSTRANAIESTVAEGRRLAAEPLRRPVDRWPTAIFAHSDQMAVGALAGLRDAGLRCPDDISIVGYSDAPLSDHLDPPLTTVRLPSFELGRHSARLIFGALANGGSKPEHIMLAPEFIERKPTRAVVS